MANFTSAILALTEERDRQFILRVAADYNLPFEELQAKYLETAEKAIKVPRKYAKKVDTVGVSEPKAKEPKAPKEKQCCTAETSKKEPCKFSALRGEVFCKRHLNQAKGERAPSEPKAKKEPKKNQKPEQPVHTHPLDKTDEACDLCSSHGNVLEVAEHDFEVAKSVPVPVAPAPHTGPVKTATVAERLAALLEDAESDAESESEEEMMGEEEYEEDD